MLRVGGSAPLSRMRQDYRLNLNTGDNDDYILGICFVVFAANNRRRFAAGSIDFLKWGIELLSSLWATHAPRAAERPKSISCFMAGPHCWCDDADYNYNLLKPFLSHLVALTELAVFETLLVHGSNRGAVLLPRPF
jgi:hypothetical protein